MGSYIKLSFINDLVESPFLPKVSIHSTNEIDVFFFVDGGVCVTLMEFLHAFDIRHVSTEDIKWAINLCEY